MFSGVHWDIQDTVLEDIERIEIIRGPGAAVWGANAVNGVINIITKKAEDTQGTLLSGTIGTEHGIAEARYGGSLSDDVFYRLYGKYRNQDNGVFEDESKATDGWNDVRGGFRVDWQIDANNQLTVQGDLYQGDMGERVEKLTEAPPFSAPLDSASQVWGGNLLTRWTQNQSDGSSQELQFYYDYSYRDSWLLEVERGTVDLDYRYNFFPWDGHNMVIGAGYRFIYDESPEKSLRESIATLNPDNRQDHLFSAFLQDDIAIIDDTLWLTLGSKFEHNDYSGFEIQPSASLRWKPAQGQLLWASVSRAVRTPSRVEHDSAFIVDKIVQPGVVSALVGNEAYDSEELIAYELGYRFQPYDNMTVDLTAFYNDYDQLRSFTPTGVSFPAQTTPVAVFNMKFENKLHGASYGFEMAVDWQLTEKWDLRASYAFLDLQLHHDSHPSNKALSEAFEGQSPEHQINLSSSYQLTQDLKINWVGRYVDQLPASNIGSHIDFDLGLRWDVTKNLNIGLFGKNLLHEQRFEYRQTVLAPEPTQIEREGHIALELRF
jgi:iron complex outermembrane receptor protein